MKNEKLSQTEVLPGAQARWQPTPRKRILLVDDGMNFRQLRAGMLVHSGYQVDAAEDGVAAWATLQANGYDLLITENDIPKVSGVELVKEMRCARMTLPVILMSVVLPTDELKQHPWLQPVATLVKPFTGGQLLRMVNQLLARLAIPAVGTQSRRGALNGRQLQYAARSEPAQGVFAPS